MSSYDVFPLEEQNTTVTWVCPTDRELILRAKLKSGWSVHSHHMFRRCETMKDSELQLVMHVIGRAQIAEKFEQERIGRMVDRLENIKKNTVGDGEISCAMCARPFGLLRSSPFWCLDCSKAVCNKCCVDIISIVHEPCMLCKICAETRELWKKSGGWFYKNLPFYILPQRNANRSNSPWAHRKPEIVRYQSFESKTNENSLSKDSIYGSSWSLNLQPDSPIAERPTSSTTFNTMASLQPLDFNDPNMLKQGSFQCLAVPGSEGNLNSMTLLSTSCPSLLPSGVEHCEEDSPTPQVMGYVEFTLIYNHRSKSLQCTVYTVKGLKLSDSPVVGTYIKAHLLPVGKKTLTLKTKSFVKSETLEFNETLVFSKIPYIELTKKYLRLAVLDEDPFKDDIIGETTVDLKRIKPMESQFYCKKLQKLFPEGKNSSGRILLSLRYSSDEHILILRIVCCSDLPPDRGSRSVNSFVKVELIPRTEDVIYHTAVQRKTLNPLFNEEFIFHLNSLELKKSALKVSVWSKTNGKSAKLIGMTILGIQGKGELQHWLEVLQNSGQQFEKWHQLSNDT